MLIIYFIGFWAGMNWERGTWEDKNLIKPKPKKSEVIENDSTDSQDRMERTKDIR